MSFFMANLDYLWNYWPIRSIMNIDFVPVAQMDRAIAS